MKRACSGSDCSASSARRLINDAVTGFSTAPLRWASHIGLALTAASLLLIVYIATR
jgi:hypothetical protein